MSVMRKDAETIAIFCSDLHLSHTAPIWRSAETNWYEAQLRPIKELYQLWKALECPIFCAGDIFDTWDSPPELINFAIKHLPEMYAIPGQHDLPHHNKKEIHKSAYWTLVGANILFPLHSDFRRSICIHHNTYVNGFAYGEKIVPSTSDSRKKHITLIHQYNWISTARYPKAPVQSKVGLNRKEFNGYSLVVSGDNHIPFDCKVGKTLFYNLGCFIRRSQTERAIKPSVLLLMSDWSLKRYPLDISKDKHIAETEEKKAEANNIDISKLISEFESLGDAKFDFVQTVKQYMDRKSVSKGVKRIIIEAMK